MRILRTHQRIHIRSANTLKALSFDFSCGTGIQLHDQVMAGSKDHLQAVDAKIKETNEKIVTATTQLITAPPTAASLQYAPRCSVQRHCIIEVRCVQSSSCTSLSLPSLRLSHKITRLKHLRAACLTERAMTIHCTVTSTPLLPARQLFEGYDPRWFCYPGVQVGSCSSAIVWSLIWWLLAVDKAASFESYRRMCREPHSQCAHDCLGT